MTKGIGRALSGSKLIIGAAILMIVAVLVGAALTLAPTAPTGGHDDEHAAANDDDASGDDPASEPISNSTMLISRNNTEIVIGLEELPAGWEVNFSYEFLGSYPEKDMMEGSASRYCVKSLGNDSVQYLTVQLFRFGSIEGADQAFEDYRIEGADHWQGIDLVTVGAVQVGDEAVLCSGNWTGSKAAIKTIAFRQNNVLCFMIHEAVWQVGLTNEATSEVAKLQAAKLLM